MNISALYIYVSIFWILKIEPETRSFLWPKSKCVFKPICKTNCLWTVASSLWTKILTSTIRVVEESVVTLFASSLSKLCLASRKIMHEKYNPICQFLLPALAIFRVTNLVLGCFRITLTSWKLSVFNSSKAFRGSIVLIWIMELLQLNKEIKVESLFLCWCEVLKNSWSFVTL